jgi:hypothetical protein
MSSYSFKESLKSFFGKVLKQSDSQQKQLISLHKQLQDSYKKLGDYIIKLEEKVNQKVRELLDAKLDPLADLSIDKRVKA